MNRRSPRIPSRLLVLTTLALVATAAAMAQPARIGELETIDIRTPHPYAAGVGGQQYTVSWPGATYIRVHFSNFRLAPGDWVEISNPAGTESYSFRGRGPHDNGQFWASTIVGDTAIVRLHAPTGGGYGFDIDSFGRGTQSFLEPTVPSDPPQTDSVCGANDWRDVKCYETSHPDQYESARAAVRLVIGCCTGCTGFKVSDSGQFMTNNHCTSTQSGVASTEARMEYQNQACGGGGSNTTGSVFGELLVATGYTYDYTLFTTTGDSSSIPCLVLANRQAANGDQMYIAHHPSGGVKKLSIESDQNAGGVCRVDDNAHTGRAVGSDIGYMCDTTNGSSGSPVLDYNTHEVIALHHFGGCLNSGGRSDRILQEIGSLIDSCSGTGGGTCGDGTCDPGEDECSCPDDCGPAPTFETSCSDGTDNDCDGFVDCDDFDCDGDPSCPVCDPSETTCDDGLDNDCDGATDCADADCSSDPACVPPPPTCSPVGASCSSHGDCCTGKCKGGRSGKTCR